MPKVLLTGFEPWSQHPTNSSEEAVTAAGLSLSENWTLDKVILPVSWKKTWATLEPRITEEVKVVISFGMSNEKKINPERIAINLCGTDQKDNEEDLPANLNITEGPPAYWSSLPVDSIVNELNNKEISATASAHAGTYLCNHLFYHLCHYRETKRKDLITGFVHLPQLGEDGMLLDSLKKAVEITTLTTLQTLK